jgi:hypothetical protein
LERSEQRWVLRTAFDDAHCHRCEAETSLVEVRLSDPAKLVFQV